MFGLLSSSIAKLFFFIVLPSPSKHTLFTDLANLSIPIS